MDVWRTPQPRRGPQPTVLPTVLYVLLLAKMAGGAGPALPPDWPEDYSPLLKDDAEFEYVVVGAGAAGAAAAARLALAGRHVLLLEAGARPGLLARVPAAAATLLGSALDWADRAAPDNRSCLAAPGRACRYSRGRCLGGSTSINYMMYVRGAPTDYDAWPSGWRWRDLEPHFLRWEGLRDLDRLPPSTRCYHNDSGIVKLEYFSDPENAWHERLLAGLEGLGFPRNPDFNGAEHVGVGRVPGYVWRGERCGTARAYLCDSSVRARLHVAQHARVTRVDIDERNVTRGVRVRLAGGRSVRVRAHREVVLAAGALGTAQLLLLSGVGPREELAALGLAVRAALPVGRGLADHALAYMFVRVPGAQPAPPSPLWLAQHAAAAARWLVERAGPLASNGLTDVTAFFDDSCYDFERQRLRTGAECARPTLQLIHAYVERGTLALAPALARLGVDLVDEVFDQLRAANARHALLIINPVLLAPASRGRVRLRGADPLLPPLVELGYLSREHDVRTLERGMRVVRQLARSARWVERGAWLLRPRLAACGTRRGGARYWRCYVRHMTHSVYHGCCTARLGAVLDARLRVRGIRGLRVADLSAAPALPRGNTAALAITLGERAAHFALQDELAEGPAGDWGGTGDWTSDGVDDDADEEDEEDEAEDGEDGAQDEEDEAENEEDERNEEIDESGKSTKEDGDDDKPEDKSGIVDANHTYDNLTSLLTNFDSCLFVDD